MAKSLQPRHRIRLALVAGIATVLLSPLVQNLMDYLGGRYNWLLLSMYSFLFLAAVGFATVLGIAVSARAFGSSSHWRRQGVALVVLLGGPIWFLALHQPGAVWELCGMADAARARVNLEGLQTWAEQTLAAASNAAPDPASSFERRPLPWESVPSDVVALLGAGGSAEVVFAADGARYVELEKRPRAFLVGDRDFRCAQEHPWFTAELSGGVYF